MMDCTNTSFECQICTHKKSTKGSLELFLKSVSVWINKPHVANRRLCGTKIVAAKHSDNKNDIEALLTSYAHALNAEHKLFETSAVSFKDLSEEAALYTLLIRELIPKSEYFGVTFEAVLYDKENKCVTFIPLGQNKLTKLKKTVELPYSISLIQSDETLPVWSQVNEISLSWSCDHESGPEDIQRQMSSRWLKTTLLDKLVSWSQIDDLSTAATSLTLVAVDRYKDVYTRLKNSYGRDLVENWTESTDPKKFVYEDIAIATYLLLIWEEDREKKKLTRKQTFVDLGCGNGLLVYILGREGHKGLGIDLRKRKIWDTFEPKVELQERFIIPSADNLFPDFDWILGNHSDELTPWIPVITARSSYTCSFFVLPCCHHDFTGKFTSLEKGKSAYGSYLDYVKEIIYACGFRPEIDTLRIPSTKRICFIGRERSYEEKHEELVDKDRHAFIDKRTALMASLIEKQKQGKKQPANKSNSPNEWKQSSKDYSDNTGTKTDFYCNSCGKTLRYLNDSVSLPIELQETYLSVIPSGSKRKASDSTQTNDHNPTIDGSKKAKDKDFCSCITNRSDDNVTFKSSDGMEESGNCQSEQSKNRQWASAFKPRVEGQMKNCQKVSETTKARIVSAVFQKVLGADTLNISVVDEEGRSWRKGGAVPLGEVVGLCDKATLLELKAECGGMQTLLRNHSHIFMVTGGQVRLRDFTMKDPWEGRKPKQGKGQERKVKSSLCWFHQHHPDGCPRSVGACLFAHGEGDMRSTKTS